MGLTKDMIFEMEWERQEEQDRLLELPSIVESNSRVLYALEERVIENDALIAGLNARLQRSEEWTVRLREYLYAGIVGAIISLVLTLSFV